METDNQVRRILTLRDQVENVLSDNPKTRDDDKLLSVAVWQKYYLPKGRSFAHLHEIVCLPSQASIKRVRAKIQNVARRFPPTNLETAKIRKMSEEAWMEAMSE